MKIGRNDPCPCGSGRKFKTCCHDLQVPVAPPSEATKVIEEVRRFMNGRSFSSLDELPAFTDRFMRQRNRAPLDDFQGLSPEQMHRILDFPFDPPELVSYAPVVRANLEAPTLTLFSLLSEAIGEQGLKATATGNLPRNVCREAASAYRGDEAIRDNADIAVINREEDIFALHVVRRLPPGAERSGAEPVL